jgi:hypothetical protein
MVFGWFKKEEKAHFDPTNMKITDIRVGFLLDYNLETFEVTDEFEYDWGDEEFTFEYKLVSANETYMLHVEVDDELKLTLSKPLLVSKISPDVKKYITQNEQAPSQVSLDGMIYFQQDESVGYFRNTKDKDSDEFISWAFIADNGKSVIEIEQWGEKEFEASIGEIIDEYSITNIFPGKDTSTN